jgi:hypothetical protein
MMANNDKERFDQLDAQTICDLYDQAIQEENIELRKEIVGYTYSYGWLPTYDKTTDTYKCQSS